MKKINEFLVRFLVVLLAFQGVVAAELINIKSAHAGVNPSVVINEVMWMGTYSGGVNHTADEWIELQNTTNSTIDLTGWKLTNVASTGDLTITAGSIPGNGYFLIANNDATNTSSVLNVEPDLVTTTVAISNSCTAIDLIDSLATTIDTMGCDGTGYFAGLNNLADKRAMERKFVIADGSSPDSWQTSTLFANLDPEAATFDLASPRSANVLDVTPPEAGQVTDDGQFTANSSQLTASWSGFTDNESGISGYDAGVGTLPGINDVVALTDVGVDTNHVFPGLALVENATYYINVVARNGIGLVSLPGSSDGITVNSVAPETPANLAVSDTPSDNGGSLTASWDASTSIDGITYQLNYRKVGELAWTNVLAGALLTKTINGLESAPVSYEFTVEAIDFSALHSSTSSTVVGQALDNLAPILDPTKLVVNQNQPGSLDTITGLAGLSNEPNIAAYVFYQDPAITPTIPTEIAIGADGGFGSAFGIGDNTHEKIWVRLFDGTNLSALTAVVTNDIVGPVSPTLNKVTASCPSDTCRVELSWQAGSIDTVSYRINYTIDGLSHQTFAVTTLAMALDLPVGQSAQFTVIGYDQFGNASLASSLLSVSLTKGVITTVTPSGTTTEGISGSLEIDQQPAPKSPAQLVPKAKAAEPLVAETAVADPLVADTSTSRDWVRIFVVVVLLLIIAGSFYALSRSVQETPEELFDAAKKKPKSAPTTNKKRRRRRRRS